MFKKLTIGKKIGFVFSGGMFLIIMIGIVSYISLNRVIVVEEFSRAIASIQTEFTSSKEYLDQFLLNSYSEGRNLQAAARRKTLFHLDKCLGLIRESLDHGGTSADVKKSLEAAAREIISYKEIFSKFVSSELAKIELETGIRELYETSVERIKAPMFKIEKMLSENELLFAASTAYFDRNTEPRWEKTLAAMAAMEKSIADWNKMFEKIDDLRVQGEKIEHQFDNFAGRIHAYHKANVTQEGYHPLLAEHKKNLDKIFSNLSSKTHKKMNAVKQQSIMVFFIFVMVTFVFGVSYAIFSTRSIVKDLIHIIKGLNAGADRVASASGQVSSSSHQLAEGASEQAASIEETSSSLEEMSSMTKQNADHAQQADHLMKEADQVITRANDAMAELTQSMGEISKAGEETFQIIKTIDEISFQTNLLALNAAVEAARAGEAGAGFAVVADEVRNLAVRAADAARNTADLIEGTVKKVNEGGEMVSTTDEAFAQVAESSKKVGELVSEIATASYEQAEGIEQVNKAVMEMDKVVQRNAANSEESAAAAEEMKDQAGQMKVFVDDLVSLVGGGAERSAEHAAGKIMPRAEAAHRPPETPTARGIVPEAREVRPGQAIPMDGDGFKDF